MHFLKDSIIRSVLKVDSYFIIKKQTFAQNFKQNCTQEIEFIHDYFF